MQYQVLQINIVRHHKNCIVDSKENNYSRDLGSERVNIQVLIPLCLAKYG